MSGEKKVLLSQRALRTVEPPINYMMSKALENPNLISLAAGFVDYETLPVRETAEVTAELLADDGAARTALQYGMTQGIEGLREKLVAKIADEDGVAKGAAGYDIEHCILTTGSQQLLYLLAEILLDEGDIAIVEHPSYWVFMGALMTAGARCVTVEMDEEGMRADKLEEKLAKIERAGELGRVKLVYNMSYYQNPTGISISDRRRDALMKVIEKYTKKSRFYVVEDAAYRELRYEGPDTRSMRSRDKKGETVCYLGTFSKPFSPGLKTGFGLLPGELMGPMLRFKGNHDFGSANFTQHVLDRVMGSDMFDKHVEELRTAYRKKMGAMLKALDEMMPKGTRTTRPRGGLYAWVTLPEGVESGLESRLFEEALKEGVLYVPGEFFYADDKETPGRKDQMRLSFSVGSPERLREGIRRLATAARRVLEDQ